MNPTQMPTWIRRCFPRDGGSNRTTDRLRRTAAEEFDAKGSHAGWVDVEFEFPGWDGKPEKGNGRVYLPAALRSGTGPLPLIHNAGYELDPAGAAGWVKQGYLVSTIRSHPLNPLGRGFLLDRAFLNAVRALPFVDNGRVSVNGGSAGGWMTLMVSSSAFPLVWTTPDVPPIHWGYNADFIARNKERSGKLGPDCRPVMPFTHAVSAITDQNMTVFGTDFHSKEWLAFSPIAHLDSITAPVLALFSTADMLVPINQVGKEWVRPIDAKQFPAGFSLDYDPRTPSAPRGRTLLEALGKHEVGVFSFKSDPGQPRITPDGRVVGIPKRVEMPVAVGKQWTVVVLDEGAPEPTVPHLKYNWDTVREPFRRHWESVGILPSQLTDAKCAHLMHRYGGTAWMPFRYQPGGKGPLRPANTLDWPEAERLDVVAGLAAFAEDDQRAERFLEVYHRLPAGLQRLGLDRESRTPAGLRRLLSNQLRALRNGG